MDIHISLLITKTTSRVPVHILRYVKKTLPFKTQNTVLTQNGGNISYL